jgi:hypothetical protein
VPLDRRPYQCARKDKQILKAALETGPLPVADLTEKQCRKNKIAARRRRLKHGSDDFGNDRFT